MPKKTLITGILALAFLISSHFFINAYNHYAINYKKLNLIRGQERFISRQIREIENKNNTLIKVQEFIDKTERLRLTNDQWDRFFVNLKDEPLSFLKLQSILEQTSNSFHYYFKPESLIIKKGGLNKTTSQQEQTETELNSSPETRDSTNSENGLIDTHIVLSLNGTFLVKKKAL